MTMNRFTKGSLITAGIFAAIGVICMLIVGIFGGREVFRSAWETGYYSRFVKFGNYNVPSNLIINNSGTTYSSDFSDTFSAKDIKNLELNIGGSEFKYVERDDENQEFDLIIKGRGYCDYSINNGILYIEGFYGTYSDNNNSRRIYWDMGYDEWDNSITLYAPKGMKYDSVDIEVGAGRADLGQIQADEFQVDIGAGLLEAANIFADDMEITVGVGKADFSNASVGNLQMHISVGQGILEGKVFGDIDIINDVGSTELKLNQKEEDFNYSLTCGIGAINLNGSSYSGWDSSRYINNNASQECSMETSIGQVRIKFNN